MARQETDWLGQKYGVGDTILYPRMMGQMLEMHSAVVLEIEDVIAPYKEHAFRVKVRPTSASRYRFSGTKDVYIHITENITVAPKGTC